uniref:RNA polymerase II-associated protein 1 C-terminal domain-containing protein n=1 Tax=Mycena chlorophos TaxID=658473 RepID=A0ABQ0LYX4_MYCCL|nr:predicted protein [Mycena chlorophos]
MSSSLVGAVFERSATSKPSSSFISTPSTTGFPQATHRSKKSAFARSREIVNPPRNHVPLVAPSRPNPPQEHNEDDNEDWRAQMRRVNEQRVNAMSDEEREAERREIMERFGPGIEDILRKVRASRQGENATAGPSTPRPEPLPPALVSPSRPSSRASKKIRFAEVTPNDVHVYESAPSSPKKKALALPPPTANDDAVSLGTWKGKQPATNNDEPEEGTPEYIRRRFFPSASSENPSLAWMQDTPPDPGSAGPAPSTLRFDLGGNLLSPDLHSTLPTHLGLHHHAPDEAGVQLAGYTLDDIFLMTRSEVKAQRAASMRMMVGIARWANTNEDQTELRPRVLAAGVEAMTERGSLGLHAVEVVGECLNMHAVADIPQVEMGSAVLSLPLTHLLAQITGALESSQDSATLGRLLSILAQLAQADNDTATEIIGTAGLVAIIFRIFLLSSSRVPTSQSTAALGLITTLASSSRTNAQALLQPADALLRFIAVLPPEDPALIVATLGFYKTLGSFGLYSHIASTAQLPLAELARFVHSHVSLVAPWAALLESWIVCATDPHHTTPEHDILWSQVVAWGWGQDLIAISSKLDMAAADSESWATVWCATAAWLEGSRINGIRAGAQERAECLAVIKPAFETDGRAENSVVKTALSAFSSGLDALLVPDASQLRSLGRAAELLMAVIRLWLACLPPSNEPISSPPFSLPFAQLLQACGKLVSHPVWSQLSICGPIYALYCPLAALLAQYLRFSKRLPDVPQDIWMAQAFAILSRLLPGDEDFATEIATEIVDQLTPEWTNSHGFGVPQAFWDKSGISVLKPFLIHIIRPQADVYVGPWCSSPRSIKRSTTQRLPTPLSAFSREFAIPLRRDWTLAPIDHLLRSAISPAFQNLPSDWDASEVDVTRAALLLTSIGREISSRFSFADFVLSREEAVFGCMKVFMLEHGQPHNDSAEEVFRDQLVGMLMENLLAKYTIGAIGSSTVDLEQVAASFLGKSTPFYQYYTDFVALYDAISFSHPIFARLLLPPTSMRYPPDYRRHLWNDFGHTLKTIRVSPEHVIAGDLGEFLWPVDTDPQTLGGYLRALLKDGVQGFLRLVAIHHIACNIWPDLRTGGVPDERAEKLLTAVIEQGPHEVVADLLRYWQIEKEAVHLPPSCFQIDQSTKKTRLEFVRRVGGDVLAERVQGLL